MFRKYLAAALRNLVRNKLYAAINIVGLAVGFAAALLIALFVRDEFSYDKWLPQYRQVYRLGMTGIFPGGVVNQLDAANAEFADLLKSNFPEIEAVARLSPTLAGLRHGDIEANEIIYYGDPDILKVLQLPVVNAIGDVTAALSQPDSIVLTEKIARKYFGNADALGQTIEIDHAHPMRVTAVIADLPSNTHLKFDIVASGRASFSTLTVFDQRSPQGLHINPEAFTYFLSRREGVDSGLLPAFSEVINRAMPPTAGRSVSPTITPIAAIHLSPAGIAAANMNAPGDRATIYAITMIGLLIVIAVSVNFISLMTARSTTRAVEVGVRKVSGAHRRDLIVQFIGEAILYVVLGTLAAAGAVKVLLPSFNGSLGREIIFVYWRHPYLILGALGAATLLGSLAGYYPAVVLSSFRPAVLKGQGIRASGRGFMRRSLALLQFAILVGLAIATAVVYSQSEFALHEGLRLETDEIVVVAPPCNAGFRESVVALPGVKGAACSQSAPFGSPYRINVTPPNGTAESLDGRIVDFGFFELFGMKLVAGRFFSPDFGTDAAPIGPYSAFIPAAIVINEEAVRRLAFDSPASAVGQFVKIPRFENREIVGYINTEIVGVVADFLSDSVRQPIGASIFFISGNVAQTSSLNIKLTGDKIPETLNAIDALWDKQGTARPIRRTFLESRVEALSQDIAREMRMLAAFSAISILVAVLGLFGLAAFTAEQRTKEIGVRKAMGARTSDVLRLLLWDFTKPVLLANLIAWPGSYFLMRRWLEGFAYHIDLSPWMFLAASALALIIAVLTVVGHALLVARAQPVMALRYE